MGMRPKSESHKFYRISQNTGREWLECEAQTAATMLLTMREDNARASRIRDGEKQGPRDTI